MQLGRVSPKPTNGSLSPAFGHCYIVNLGSNIDPGRIGICDRELGPSPVAFALRAVAASGLALRSCRLNRWFLFPRLLACPCHGILPLAPPGIGLPAIY